MMKRHLKNINDNRKKGLFCFFLSFCIDRGLFDRWGLGPSVACRGRQPSR